MFVILQFPYSILNFYSEESEENFFFKWHAWISTYSVNRIGETDNVRVFSLSRGAWGFVIKIKYFPIEIGIF